MTERGPAPRRANDRYACLLCGSESFSVFRTGGSGAGPRFWHVACARADCAIIIIDARNDSGSVIPLLSEPEARRHGPKAPERTETEV